MISVYISMHICTYMVTVGVYWWDSVGPDRPSADRKRPSEAAVSSSEVARRSRHGLHNYQCFQHLLTVCTHKYRLFRSNYSTIWEETLFLHVGSDRFFHSDCPAVCEICVFSLWAVQPCSGEVRPDGGVVAPRWGIWRVGLEQEGGRRASPRVSSAERSEVLRYCGGGEELHSAFFIKISLRITQTGESVITVRRMASRGPKVGSTSPSAIPFWKVPILMNPSSVRWYFGVFSLPSVKASFSAWILSKGRTSTDVLKSLSPGCSMFPLRKKYLSMRTGVKNRIRMKSPATGVKAQKKSSPR